jgi:hypothetical protein
MFLMETSVVLTELMNSIRNEDKNGFSVFFRRILWHAVRRSFFSLAHARRERIPLILRSEEIIFYLGTARMAVDHY